MGNVVTLTPSLTLTKEQMDFALDAIDEGLNSLEELRKRSLIYQYA